MFRKIFPGLMVITAIVMAVLACVLPPERQQDVALIYKFFQHTLAILAFAALVKYLLSRKQSDKIDEK